MALDGMRAAPARRPVGAPDVIWPGIGAGGLLTEWTETVPDLTWPESVRTYARMRRDSRLSAILKAYFLPLVRATWAVDPEGVDRAEAVDVVASDLGLPVLGEKGRPADPAIPGFRWHEHVRLALLSLVYGHMPFERWYDTGGPRTRLAGVSERQPHTIAIIDVDDMGQVRQVEQSTQLAPIPARNLVWYVNEREGANWAGVSLLRPCYTPWVLKHETMRVHATSIRRFGMGVPSVKAPNGTPAEVEEARRLAAGMRAGDQAGAGLPPGFEFSLTGLTGNVPDAVAFLNFCNQEMTGSALTQMLELGQTAYGPRALGDTFLDLFLLSLQAGADAVGDTATIGDPAMPGLARDLVELNWGEGEPVPRIVAADVGDRHEITAAAIAELVKAGALTLDENLESFVRQAWGLPERKKTELPPPPPSPGGGGPGPGGGPATGEPPPPPAPPGQGQEGAPAPSAQPARAARRRRLWPFRAAPPPGLRRNLSAAEAAAGMDPQAIDSEWQAARDRLLGRWEPVARAQAQDLAEQVAAAVDGGHLDRLATLKADPSGGADMLAEAMSALAWTAAARLIREAAAQGVTIDPAKVKIDDGRLAKVAKARAGLAGARLAAEAGRRALRVVAATAGSDAGEDVTVFLAGLSPVPLADQLGAAMSAAQNMGRVEAIGAGLADNLAPVCFASEILDQNTCGPCEAIDGEQFGTVDEAEAAYANGGYVECEGELRCRGTLIVQWAEGQAPEPETPESIFASMAGQVSLGGDATYHEPMAQALAKIPDKVRADLQGRIKRIEIRADLGTLNAPEGKVRVAGWWNHWDGTLALGTRDDVAWMQKAAVHEALHAFDTHDVKPRRRAGEGIPTAGIPTIGRYSARSPWTTICYRLRNEQRYAIGAHGLPDAVGSDVKLGDREIFAELGAQYLRNEPYTIYTHNVIGNTTSPTPQYRGHENPLADTIDAYFKKLFKVPRGAAASFLRALGVAGGDAEGGHLTCVAVTYLDGTTGYEFARGGEVVDPSELEGEEGG